MIKTMKKLFNWKDNPENVFILAIPLAAMAFFCVFAVAALQIKENGDYWYLVITLAGLALLAFCLKPIFPQLVKELKE